MRNVFVAFLYLFFSLTSALYAQGKPMKILSLSSTGDEFLEIFVHPSRILSLSSGAGNPETSTVSTSFAQSVTHSITPTAEPEISLILDLSPDLILADWLTSDSLITGLKKSNVNLEILKEPSSWEDVRIQSLRAARILKADPVGLLDVMHKRRVALESLSALRTPGTEEQVALVVSSPLNPREWSFYQEQLRFAGLSLVALPEGANLKAEWTIPGLLLEPGREGTRFLPLPWAFLITRGPGAIIQSQNLFHNLVLTDSHS